VSIPIIPRVWALAPWGRTEAAPVVAACRAGGLGLLDFGLGQGTGIPAIAAASGRIGRFTDRPFGVRLPAALLADWPRDGLVSGPSLLLCTEPPDGDWSAAFGKLPRRHPVLAAEVTSRASALRAAEAGAIALVVAGHEAGGWVGEESAFILAQGVLAEGGRPLWVRGGIGPRTAAACRAAGAEGVVLDGALLLAKESPLDGTVRARLDRLDGGETTTIRAREGAFLRVWAPTGSPALARLRAAAAEGGPAWAAAILREVGWGPDQVWPVGQDAAFAAGLARRQVTIGGIVLTVAEALEAGPRLAASLRPLAEGSPLAASHGTRFPIVQGPMTRVSDTPAFALAVAEGGALPFLALALLKGPEARTLLAETQTKLAGRPWGVGILGFVPPELRLEQIAAIREVRPPFALIAGGRPDQAADLEREGIATYLHVPSPGLLRQYLKGGARRFVLEGRECGGHVGPRSGFTLWEQAAEVLDQAISQGLPADEVHLLFAGGIHDARSATMVAALAAPLAEAGVKVGVLVGTAYLFTREAVVTGAIVPGFQAAALVCDRTILLESGPGHEVRVSPSPFAATFGRERSRMVGEGRSAEEIRVALERRNAGRLRVAAKGVDRAEGAGSALVAVTPEDQYAQGLYMVGQVAALRDRATTIVELHREICGGESLAKTPAEVNLAEARETPSEIAIIGMSAIVPGAGDVRSFWENTLRGFDAITEIPADRWDWRAFYDSDPKTPDKISSKWGGFLPDVPFDPLRYGMPPTTLPSIEPMHLLTLEAVRAALDDAGYRDREFARETTAVVLGAGGGAAQLAMGYAFRSYLPMLDSASPGTETDALARFGSLLPEWTEDSFPGILLNVAAGRVANRFDLGGANYTVDAACGSSLAAAALAVRELESGAADVVILGGADTVQNPFTYLAFSKTHAFSPRGRCRPFDASADGIVISEGVAVLVLKRLADAERDGDRIYAVIKGVGASSDGRAKGLTAPRPEGQVRAVRRAYAKAGIAPATVGYVEAHGTGTAAGDAAEIETLTTVFREDGARAGGCVVGSVKSSIGHTKCAAGLAGLINATLALYHGVLPPTIGIKEPTPRADWEGGPFRLNTQARPWLHAEDHRPRRAGVSAFGFGGTNFHAVLEAYDRDPTPAPAPSREWPAELVVLREADREALRARVARVIAQLDADPARPLSEISAGVTSMNSAGVRGPTLAIVATTASDLRAKLGRAGAAIAGTEAALHDPGGVYFAASPAFAGAKVAFLFPGQGAQAPDMLAELAVAFPEVRAGFEETDAALLALGKRPVGPLVFAAPAFDEPGRRRRKEALLPPEVAQPAVCAACLGMLRLLRALGVDADLAAGHSYGELVALHAAGSFSAAALAGLSEARGRFLAASASAGAEAGAMAAIAAGPDRIAAILEGLDGVSPVNWNGPAQTVVSGTLAGVARALARAKLAGVAAQELPVACAFHSPLVAGACAPLAAQVAEIVAQAPRLPVYSNVTAAPYPADPAAIAAILGEHVATPVRFAEMVGAMHADGARVFVEVGPGATLSPLVGAILADRPHLGVATGRNGLASLLHALAKLAVAGVPMHLDRLTADRLARPIAEVPGPSTWLVNGTRARPIAAPEPPRLGVAGVLAPPSSKTAAHHGNGNAHVNGAPKPSSGNGVHAHSPPAPASTPGLPRFELPLGKPNPPPSHTSDAGRVVEAFQETMRAFLDLQRTTMLGYLAGRETAPAALPPSPDRVGPAEIPRDAAVGVTRPSPARMLVPVGAAVESPDPGGRSPVILRPGREGVAERLLEIVRERTGYPAEMLRLDLDLEGDLGIDSIKRVEILGSLRDALPTLGLALEGAAMDALARAKTLGAIVDRLGMSPGEGVPESPATTPPVRRLTIELIDAPLAPRTAGLAPGGIVLVTDDGRGVARDVAADLKALGHPVVRVRHGVSNGGVEGVNFTSEAAVSALLDRIRNRGPIAGIVHALPLREAPDAGLDAEAWASRMGPEVRGLYLLARGAADDLERSANAGGATLIAATAMGGAFASAGEVPDGFFPGQGGIAGLVKTLAREWPLVRARVVDFDPRAEVEVLAADLVQEVRADDPRAEVGYRRGQRIALRTVAAPLGDGAANFDVKPGAPVIVTGGARGITAAIAADLATRWRPTLLLIGSSPLPPEEESAETAPLQSPQTLRTALLALLRREGKPDGTSDVERAYQTLRGAREFRANLRALREAGSVVEYAQADVRDSRILGQTLAGWRGRFGPPAGLIHGAGVIRDKLLRDKTPESFDCVLGTKLDGALTLARAVDPSALTFAAFFSSVAGRFGNPGQADYAAANEALNKLATWLDRRWPTTRVVSMIWGPWSGVGMVADLEGHLRRRGLGMIAPEVGRSKLGDELRGGRKGDVEVIIAGDLGTLEGPR